jgi:hypothetical protein
MEVRLSSDASSPSGREATAVPVSSVSIVNLPRESDGGEVVK